MLCIFAGSNTGFLVDAEILTVNSSMLGEFVLNTTSSSSGDGLLGALQGALSQIEGIIQGDIDRAIHSFAQGYYEPTPIANSTFTPSMNVTGCSNKAAPFHFNLQAILQSELNTNYQFSDLHWPAQVQNTEKDVRTATTVMFVCYCIGVGFAGLAIVGGLVAFFMDTRLADFVNFMLYFIAFLALGIASAVSTVIAVKVVDAVNKYGNEIGVSAYRGNKFMAMTWAATAIMLLGSILWIIDCCVPRARRKQVTYVKEGKEGRL
ncbi:MAG: hypothetical protein MMC33_008847 [Icmadophila ericetorum]|nr:hypothetical protein [Icmadophila ericetorum]